MPGVSRCGPHATGEWMREFGSWYFDLARGHDGSFHHQGPPQARPDAYHEWDATGSYLIAYGMPLEAIRLTGRKPSVAPQLDAEAARQVVHDGCGWSNNDRNSDYDRLETDELLRRLGSWSPVVRERAAMAIGRRKTFPAEPLIKLLEDPALEARIGGCQAIAQLRGRAAKAVPKLRETLHADHLWLRVKAAIALAAIGQPAMVAVPELLERLAVGPTEDDPDVRSIHPLHSGRTKTGRCLGRRRSTPRSRLRCGLAPRAGSFGAGCAHRHCPCAGTDVSKRFSV